MYLKKYTQLDSNGNLNFQSDPKRSEISGEFNTVRFDASMFQGFRDAKGYLINDAFGGRH